MRVIFNASALGSNNILCLAIFFCGCLDSQLLPTIEILSVVISILYSKQGGTYQCIFAVSGF